MSSDNDGLGPAGYKSRDVFDDNWFSENGTVQDVTNSSIRAFPHLFESELFNAVSVRSDRGTLDSNLVLEHGIGTVNSDLVIGSVAILDGQIIVLSLQIQVGSDMLKYKYKRVSGELSGLLTTSLIHCQMTRVISSPSISTIGLATCTFLKEEN